MNEYSEPTNRFISNIGRAGHTYRWETPITKEDLKLIMLDLMKDCGLEFSDVQHMSFSTKTFIPSGISGVLTSYSLGTLPNLSCSISCLICFDKSIKT